MASLMCFRQQKKGSFDGSSPRPGKKSKGDKNNAGPDATMVLQGPVDEGLSVQYITPRIIAVTSPLHGTESAYKASLSTLVRHLKTKHSGDFRVWNASRPRGDLARGVGKENLIEIGWPSPLAPPLDRLCSVCKQLEQWLQGGESRVAVIHSKGSPQRAAVLVSSFMHYNVICANDDAVEERFSMQRFVEKNLGVRSAPSNQRYINYFTSLLSGKVTVNPAPVYLKEISLIRFPSRTEVVFKVYERLLPVYISNIMTTDIKETRLDVNREVRLRGDVLVKCFEEINTTRRLLFSCQFNTCVFPRPPPALIFHGDQLDSLHTDSLINGQSQVEFVFAEEIDMQEVEPACLPMNANSYEDFALLEDGDLNVEYSQIVKPSACGTTNSGGANSEDSGISIESPKLLLNTSDEASTSSPLPSSSTQEGSVSRSVEASSLRGMAPPPVPPKPRPSSAMDEASEYGEMPERRGALPASVRALMEKEKEAARATPAPVSIEPDLVGKDRYDKASKCFSYAPTKDLKQAFVRPRKKSFSQHDEETALIQALMVRPEEVNNVEIKATDISRMPEEPKWTEEVDRARQAAQREEENRWRSRPTPPIRSHSSIGDAYSRNRYDDHAERPQVVEQARKISTGSGNGSMRRKPNYGSYRTLNDDAYNSDMDDLCDPDFYFNYSEKQGTLPYRSQSTIPHAGAKSEQMPRKQFGRANNEGPLENISTYNNFSVARPVPASSMLDLNDDRDTFRQRNCRSVSHAPNNDRKLFADKYDALEGAERGDDWLDLKLKKLKSKRNMDPDLVRRRTQEKMLLEELKNAHGDKEAARNRREADYSVEGVGRRSEVIDPLLEYRREEERLKNTNSPFDMEAARRTPRALRHKPPTPPPRERSRSPPYRAESLSRLQTPSIDQNGHRGGGAYQRGNDYQLNGFDDDMSSYGDFSTLRSIVQGERPESRPVMKKPSYNTLDFSRRSHTPTHFLSGQERVASAISRAETPNHMNYYPMNSSTIDRSETPALVRSEKPQEAAPQYPQYQPDRAETPAFPVSRETPVPYHPLLYNSTSNVNGGTMDRNYSSTLNFRSASPRSQYYGTGMSRRSSMNSLDQGEVVNHHPIFVKDTSKYWYKPHISREQAISILRDKPPGTFVIRDSNSFPGAFGLALKVSQPPPGVAPDNGNELVRHFLIEPSNKGVKLKGCNNEPVFGTLSALVYQHSMTPLALPCKLLLPDYDPSATAESLSATQALLEQGAACNVTFIGTIDCESLTGPECVRRSVHRLMDELMRGEAVPVSAHFKVSSQGVTLTDNTRKVFFRRHYPVNSVIFAGLDPSNERFDNTRMAGFQKGSVEHAKMFAFVARKFDRAENSCHVFAELEQEQPATAVVNFINKVMLAQRRP